MAIFDGVEMTVCGVKVAFQKGELTFRYQLKQRENVNAIYRDVFTGQYFYNWYPETGNSLYAMPEPGTRAVLYFGDKDEREGFVLHSLPNAMRERWYYKSRHLDTKEGNMLHLNEGSIDISNGGSRTVCLGNSFISANSGGNFRISAEGSVKMSAKRIIMRTPDEVNICQRGISMKKKIKYLAYIVGAISLFILGVLISNCWNVIKSEQAGDKELLQEMQKTEKKEKDFYTLTEEEKTFLQEHLYGQWRFSERIVEIDEDNNIQYGAKPNISDVGVEELKESVRIEYDENYVSFSVKIGQNSFTYAQDMYLFAANGGFCWSMNPVYSINEMEGDVMTLNDVYNINGYKVSAKGMEKFNHVTYFTMPDSNNSELCGNIFTYFGSDIYINPRDKDTIYLDFCGLWKMERDDDYYGTNGKSEY